MKAFITRNRIWFSLIVSSLIGIGLGVLNNSLREQIFPVIVTIIIAQTAILHLFEVRIRNNITTKIRAFNEIEEYPDFARPIESTFDNYKVIIKSANIFHNFFLIESHGFFSNLDRNLADLASGRLTIYPGEHELNLTRDLIIHIKHSLKAVSYNDYAYWNEPRGKVYLKRHEEKIREGISVFRIFIFSDYDEAKNAQAIVLEHQQIGIQVFIGLQSLYMVPSDFVIYDNAAVRYTQLDNAHDPLERGGIFTIDTVDVNRYIRNYEAMLDMSEAANDFYSKLR